MEVILFKAGIFILIIFLGGLLRGVGFFKKEDFSLLSKVVLNITLPCAVITNFSKLTFDPSLLFLVPIGIGANLVLIGLGYLFALRKRKGERAFNMLNFAGFNIGCFTLPYVQSFLGAPGVVATCLFDAGNAILCTGGTYALASVVASGEKTSPLALLKKLFRSVPVDTYILMLLLACLNIKLPSFITGFAETVGAANSFLAMLMVGVGFELHLEKKGVFKIAAILLTRLAVASLIGLVAYYALPLPLETRQIVVLILFSPIAALTPAFTQKIGEDISLSSTATSASVIVGILAMTTLMAVWGIG